MTTASHIISSAADLENHGEAEDIMTGIDLATGLAHGEGVAWDEYPLGSEAISFAKSEFYKKFDSRTYGDIARQFIAYRLAYLGRDRTDCPMCNFNHPIAA